MIFYTIGCGFPDAVHAFVFKSLLEFAERVAFQDNGI